MLRVVALLVMWIGMVACAADTTPSPPMGGDGLGVGDTPSGAGTGGNLGAAGTGGEPAGADYVSMAPPLREALARGSAGEWQYHEIEGAQCRDGSPAGFYTRFSDTTSKLVIYLEQGGACFNPALCKFNPERVTDRMTGRTLNQTISGLQPGERQQPPITGMFDHTRADNPYRDWNMVWIPYYTGDAHGGSAPNTMVPGVREPQQFVGYMNMQKFVGHIVPTFEDAEHVVLTGTSAGSFGAGLNFNQVQDAFGDTPVSLIMDSGTPFTDAFMGTCLQANWRQLWNYEALLPPECAECRQADGGGLIELVFFSARKYPNAKMGVISALEDDVMRFFLGFGENGCTGGDSYAEGRYTEALANLREAAVPYAANFASYYVPGIDHMYVQFDDFYQPMSGGVSIADWVSDVLAGSMRNVGP